MPDSLGIPLLDLQCQAINLALQNSYCLLERPLWGPGGQCKITCPGARRNWWDLTNFPPSQYMTQGRFFWWRNIQIQTFTLLDEKMLGILAIPLLECFRCQTINSTLQGRYSPGRRLPETRRSVFSYLPGTNARWSCQVVGI